MMTKVLLESLLVVAVLFAAVQARETTECTLCEGEAEKLQYALSKNGTWEDVYVGLTDLCRLLPSQDQAKCNATAQQVTMDLRHELIWVDKGFSPFALCSMLSICNVYCCLDLPFRPAQVHLAATGDPTEMRVTWVLGTTTANQQVQYGTDPSDLSMSAPATYTSYTWGGWYGIIYTAKMVGLTPDTKYYYRVGDPETDWSFTDFYFKSAPPAPKSGEGHYRVAVYGDMGVTDVSDLNAFFVKERVHQGDIDFIMHAGDISYANGYQASWDIWFQKMELVGAYVPYMTAVGNHEVPYNFTAYKHRYIMPYEESGSPSQLYSSFDYGNMHIVSYSFEEEFGLAPDTKKGAEQYDWLVNDLEAAVANRAAVPWIVVYGHRPFYCSNTEVLPCEIEATMYRHRFEDLFKKYNVDLVISAHMHSYERTWPLYKHTSLQKDYDNPRDPVYIIAGTGGTREMFSSFKTNKPDWSVTRLDDWGFSVMEPFNATTLRWQFISGDDGQTVLDDFTMTKQH